MKSKPLLDDRDPIKVPAAVGRESEVHPAFSKLF